MMVLAMSSAISMRAQTDVTSKYLDNPDFAARFAAWENAGSFTYNTANTFSKSNGDVWMEKYVAKGSKLGTNQGMYQKLSNMTTGTYTLIAGAQHINQNNTSAICTGGLIYANDATTEVHEADDYSVEFTVVNGKATVGAKLTSATGNWFCIDNFRLIYNGVDNSKIDAELDKVIAKAEGVYKEGGKTAGELLAAIDKVKALKGKGAEGVSEAVTALQKATITFRIENATGSTPKVTTHPYVAMGTTIALGRLTVSGSAAEKGFCWSKHPNPTILDETSTLYYSNNGNIYHMENLEPGTIYYVRAYARTSTWKVGYGEVVKIATLPKGTVNYSYDFAGDEQQNRRINSASAETVWMYNNLSNIRGFYLQVHYVWGAGAGDGTADCSYGGWMRVSQKEAYQQTGTILHETNHGVGVGTTGEWYNNANLRAETSRGLWLGPRATSMVRFFDNSSTSTLTGDGTHMWPYGINGAHEDSYQPSNKPLYYANILITHALHQDGLPCSSSVGFATPAYVFTQMDSVKYYIKCEEKTCGGLTSYLGMTSTGLVKNFETEDVFGNDDCAWYIGYDPKTCYYTFYNIGQERYLTFSSNTIKGVKKTTPGSSEKFHLMPSRQSSTLSNYSGSSFWVLSSSGHSALEGSTTFNKSTSSYNTVTSGYNASNSAASQRWFLMTEQETKTFEDAAIKVVADELEELLKNAAATVETPHTSAIVGTDTQEFDDAINTTIEAIQSSKDNYKTTSEIKDAINSLKDAITTFLSGVKITDPSKPFNLTYFLVNPGLTENSNGWSTTATINYGCAEFYQKSADFSQTTSLKMPAGTYEVRAQAFQRSKAYADAYKDYQAGTDEVKAQLYVKTKNTLVKNIFDDAQSTSPGSGSVAVATKVYIPNNMQSASYFFKKNLYDNCVMVTTSTAATMKLGIKTGTSNNGSWTMFDNFRLFSYGNMTQEEILPVKSVSADPERGNADTKIYDLSGRRVSTPGSRGIFIVNGKKVVF